MARTCVAALSYLGPLGVPLAIVGTTQEFEPQLTRSWPSPSDPAGWFLSIVPETAALREQIAVNEYGRLRWYVGAPGRGIANTKWLEVSDHLVRARTVESRRGDLEQLLTSDESTPLPTSTPESLLRQPIERLGRMR